jgi:hypothetical protein
MNLIFPNEGLTEQLQRILGGEVTYRLFTNDVTPSASTRISDLTEAGFDDYTPVTLNSGDFGTMGVSGNSGFAIASPISFHNASSTDQDVFGFYATNVENDILLAVSRFTGAPVTISPDGSVSIIPTWGDFSQFTTST